MNYFSCKYLVCHHFHIFSREQCTLDTTSCVPIAQHLNRTCLGNHLPYKLTASIPLDEDVTFYSLEFWTALQSIPTCWDKLQYFLCSVYIPECVIIKTSKSTESNQSYSNNYSVSVTNYQEFNREYLPVDNSLSSSSPSFINAYRVVLPEAEMCEAVHKACPLLFSLVFSDAVKIINPQSLFLILFINPYMSPYLYYVQSICYVSYYINIRNETFEDGPPKAAMRIAFRNILTHGSIQSLEPKLNNIIKSRKSKRLQILA
ncbi:hypothetical protein MN116_008722 [Schistosoma mekongi]|uniref:Uncharacterized protein n=1 Tax=Schistosoma mekongi TaxID=38744 RepID=A0AAE1Z562_SCHME|nr:hypothetical protein MN116_008722 [Schistosoma mekongi]